MNLKITIICYILYPQTPLDRLAQNPLYRTGEEANEDKMFYVRETVCVCVCVCVCGCVHSVVHNNVLCRILLGTTTFQLLSSGYVYQQYCLVTTNY